MHIHFSLYLMNVSMSTTLLKLYLKHQTNFAAYLNVVFGLSFFKQSISSYYLLAYGILYTISVKLLLSWVMLFPLSFSYASMTEIYSFRFATVHFLKKFIKLF